MKKVLIIILMLVSELTLADEYIFKDEIRGGVKQVQLTSEEHPYNGRIIIFVKEKAVEFQFQSQERVPGIHINDPKSIRWTPIISDRFSIRFDPNLIKILSDSELLQKSVNVWPACLKNDCSTDPRPKIIENVKGKIWAVEQPDSRIKYILSLTNTEGEFEGFYLLYRGSKRIIIEVDNKQYTFNISR